MLVTGFAILVTNINNLFTLTSGTNKDAINIAILSPTLSHQHHDVTYITVTKQCESGTGITTDIREYGLSEVRFPQSTDEIHKIAKKLWSSNIESKMTALFVF